MSTEAGAAPAAAESLPAPADGAALLDNAPNFNAPLGSQVPGGDQPAPKEAKAPASLDDALDRAIAKNEAKSKAPEAKPEPKAEPKVEAKAPPKVEPKAEPKAEQPRENGRFVSSKPAEEAKTAEVKPSHTAEDAPARFTDTAKAKWHAADPEIRGEVLRMQRELTDGFQKYKSAAERDNALAEYHEIAGKSGTTLKEAIARYYGLEEKIRTDLLGGLDDVIANATGGKYSLRDIAAHVMGQKPEDVQSQSDATIRELKNEIAALKEQVGGVTSTIKQQREQSTLTEINKFAADHPRFEELSEDIALFMKTGRAKDLPSAYELAERLNPAPAKVLDLKPDASSAPAPDLSAQPDKGQKSINGAPSPGLTSSTKRVAKSLDDALDRAFGAVG